MNISLRHMLALLCIVGVSGIEARSRRKIEWPTTTYSAVDRGVAIEARILTRDETKALFNARGGRLLGNNPVMPVEVRLENQSDRIQEIKEISATFKLLSEREIKNRLNKTMLKTLAFGTLGVAVTGLSGIALGYVGFGIGGYLGWVLFSSCPCPCAMLPGALLGSSIGFAAGASLGGYYFFRQGNQEDDFPIILQPGETHVCYVFTKDYKALTSDFSIFIA